MTDPVRVLDQPTRVTPVGVRFWDPVAGVTIDDGLAVAAYRPVTPESIIEAFRTRGGVYAFRDLPGLRAAEQGTGDAEFWRNPPRTLVYRILVEDRRARFQPFTFDISAPVRGLVTLPQCVPAESTPSAIPLYSAPTRTVPAGFAALRATLVDASTGRAARWAVLQVRARNRVVGRSYADREGRLLVLFPYPAPLRRPVTSPPASPPTSAAQPLVEATWPVEVRAFYGAETADVPDLCRVLGQPPGQVWAATSPPTPLEEQTLRFGRELLVSSPGRSELLITAAGSPP